VLDLEALISHMHDLAEDVAGSARHTLRQREAGHRQLDVARSQSGLRQAIQKFGQDMALPADGRDMGQTYPALPAEDYTVIATDGSQVAPDYHHIAPWYVLNAGCAVFRYGAPPERGRCRLSSHPTLLPARNAAADPESDGRAAAAAPSGPLEVERLLAELELGIRLLEQEADPGRTLVLLDGPLVQWRMIHELRNPKDRQRAVEVFRRLLNLARETGAAVAGYISRSRAIEWVLLLRFSLCPEVAKGGSLCAECRQSFLWSYAEPPPDAHHAPLAGLRDVELAQMLLPRPGMRTEVIELKSRVWEEITGGGSAAGFFYLNTGCEIGRVELPQWVWEDDDLMERLHAGLWDQCDAGAGYPMVLAEAHEAAVVRAADREAFYGLIERILGERGVVDPSPSAKAMSKRRPFA